jgi:hypothetical protein
LLVEAQLESCDVIKEKLGWKRDVVKALKPVEVEIVLAMIEKHDEAERRLEHRANRLSTDG